MNDAPRQGTNEQVLAKAMTNLALGSRLESIANAPRTWTRAEKDAFLHEASHRLRWPDLYRRHMQGQEVWPQDKIRRPAQ